MATHDYVIANQTGANTRSDLNNAFSAIVSNNSSATEPSTTYAYMWWADTANDLLKQRNAADSAWINILTLSTGAVSNAAVADNAITLAKMAHGTDGEIITYDSSGAPATVAVGTSGQVLTSNGAGSAPTMQGLPSSGADTSLSNLTATGENKVCQAWVNFNGTGTVAINNDYNVSSITDNGTGDYTVNFSNALANANYSPTSYCEQVAGDFTTISKHQSYAHTTTSCRVQCRRHGSTIVDSPVICTNIFGD